ncbi:MAG: hypothetical protein ACR2GA_02140 [Chloroflexota bacterium]
MTLVKIALVVGGLTVAIAVMASHSTGSVAVQYPRLASPGVAVGAPLAPARMTQAQVLTAALQNGAMYQRAKRVIVTYGSWTPNWGVTIKGKVQPRVRADYWIVKFEGVVDAHGNGLIPRGGGDQRADLAPPVPNWTAAAFIVDDTTGQIVESIPYG